MAELVDAPDLKSGDRIGRAGSIPAPGTTFINRFCNLLQTSHLKIFKFYIFRDLNMASYRIAMVGLFFFYNKSNIY